MNLWKQMLGGGAAAVLALSCAGPEIGVMKFPAGEVQHVVRADGADWKPCPPALPKDCEMAVLEGNPKAADLFTVRFRVREKMKLPPHWHPKDERVTIISGKVAVAFGADSAREDATEFGAGDYYVNARHQLHSVWVEGPTVIQITGIGPWKAVYLSDAPPPK